MLATANKLMTSVGIPAGSYMRGIDSYFDAAKDGDTSAKMHEHIKAQNVIDSSKLSEVEPGVYKAFCSSIQKLSKSAKYYRIERFLNLVLRRN